MKFKIFKLFATNGKGMSAYPFEDEVSFKAWQNEATKAKPPRGVKPPPPPSDSEAPSAEEIAMTAKVKLLLF